MGVTVSLWQKEFICLGDLSASEIHFRVKMEKITVWRVWRKYTVLRIALKHVLKTAQTQSTWEQKSYKKISIEAYERPKMKKIF